MLKSKKFWLAVILIVVTNIGTAVGCMFLAETMTAMHIFSVYSNLNFLRNIQTFRLRRKPFSVFVFMRFEMFFEEMQHFCKTALSTTVLYLRELFRRIKIPSRILCLLPSAAETADVRYLRKNAF